jgi:hypothetical protein
MASLLDSLGSVLGPQQIEQIAKQIGADPKQTEGAIGLALPSMISALARNSSTSQGAEQLSNALARDHDGSLLDKLPGLLGGGSSGGVGGMLAGMLGGGGSSAPPASSGGLGGMLGGMLGGGGGGSPTSGAANPGGAILGHIFGKKTDAVNNGISKNSGLSGMQTTALMGALAPIVMGMLGRRKQQGNLSPIDLQRELGAASQEVEQQPGGSFLGRMLDQDGDGDFDMKDMMAFATKRIFGRR